MFHLLLDTVLPEFDFRNPDDGKSPEPQYF
jgi:hypothetical protein